MYYVALRPQEVDREGDLAKGRQPCVRGMNPARAELGRDGHGGRRQFTGVFPKTEL